MNDLLNCLRLVYNIPLLMVLSSDFALTLSISKSVYIDLFVESTSELSFDSIIYTQNLIYSDKHALAPLLANDRLITYLQLRNLSELKLWMGSILFFYIHVSFYIFLLKC